MKKKQKIIIVGAGLSGSLLAILMAKKGFQVALYEKRSDMRKGVIDAGRSINLALSNRGLKALAKADLTAVIEKNCIPMKGRMIHPLNGEMFLSPYSGKAENHINSVSRPGLNQLLLEEADKYNNIDIIFDARVTNVDLENATIHYNIGENTYSDTASIVIGTDGAGSAVRRSMMQKTTTLLFNYSQNFLRHGYKELSIHPAEAGGWKIFKEALHIWPRGDFMIIALPNLDGSFTLTMFHPFDTEIGFNALDTPAKVQQFFEAYYPTLLPYIPHYKEEYFKNPVGTLGTIKCYPWQAYGKSLIMGDAAHAIVPFYGQGMNASFEDVRVFDDLVDKKGDDWKTVFADFQEVRHENANAIADLAIDNFYEMRDKVKDVAFMRKRQVEMALEKNYEDYASKYSMVTFHPEIAYEDAMILGRKQDDLLLQMCSRDDYEQISLASFYTSLKQLRDDYSFAS